MCYILYTNAVDCAPFYATFFHTSIHFIFTVVNIGLGLSLFQNPCGGGEGSGYPVVDFYVGWLLGFVVLSHIIMFLLFTFLALQSRGQGKYFVITVAMDPVSIHYYIPYHLSIT